jgi:hypothetical protein
MFPGNSGRAAQCPQGWPMNRNQVAGTASPACLTAKQSNRTKNQWREPTKKPNVKTTATELAATEKESTAVTAEFKR